MTLAGKADLEKNERISEAVKIVSDRQNARSLTPSSSKLPFRPDEKALWLDSKHPVSRRERVPLKGEV